MGHKKYFLGLGLVGIFLFLQSHSSTVSRPVSPVSHAETLDWKVQASRSPLAVFTSVWDEENPEDDLFFEDFEEEFDSDKALEASSSWTTGISDWASDGLSRFEKRFLPFFKSRLYILYRQMKAFPA